MDESEKLVAGIKDLSGENIGLLIWRELKLLRRDIKEEMKSIGMKVDNVVNKLEKLARFQSSNYYNSDTDMHDESCNEHNIEPYVPTKPNYRSWEKHAENNGVETAQVINVLNELSPDDPIVHALAPLSEEDSVNASSYFFSADDDSCMVEIEVTSDKLQSAIFSQRVIESEECDISGFNNEGVVCTDSSDEIMNTAIEPSNQTEQVKSVVPTQASSRPISVLQPLRNSHLHRVVKSENPGYMCQKCKIKLPSVVEYKKHLRIHKLKKCLRCGVDVEQFQFKDHTCLSTIEDQLQCTICDKKLSNKGNLKRHMNRHNGVKEFICETCGKCFAVKADLKRHSLLHGGVKPIACKVCQKTFYRKDAMKGHMKIHR